MKKVMLKEFNGVNASEKAYEIAEREFKDLKMTCAECGGELIISPYVKNAYFKKSGILCFELCSINYCENCWK